MSELAKRTQTSLRHATRPGDMVQASASIAFLDLGNLKLRLGAALFAALTERES